MRRIVAVVPINALDQAKSRLSGILTPEERRRLVFWMAGRLLRTIALSGVAERILVVSLDADALDWVAARGATPIHQDGGRLNSGLFQARRAALHVGAEALLVLLADLPLLTPDELRAFVASTETPAAAVGEFTWTPSSAPPQASPRPVVRLPRREGLEDALVALAPDRRRVGTNGMLLRPADAIPFAFGRASFGRHTELAATAGITPRVFTSPGFAFDVDEPDDIATLRLRGLWTPSDDFPQLSMKEGA